MRRILFDKTLDFEINLIGYRTKGESIVFFLKADNKVVYSGLVDCYEDESGNVALELMKKENIDSFDFVCWTHPHDDHTLGMDSILTDYCNEKTLFWMPPFISKDVEACSKYSQTIYTSLFDILKSRKRTKMSIREASDAKTLEKLVCYGNCVVNPYTFEIRSFAPDTMLLGKLKVEERYEMGNIYSIGLILNIGHFYIVLAGDVENKSIRCIPDFNIDINGSVDYIKIPHHSSPTASDLIEKLSSLGSVAPAVATTTVYRIHGLPDKNILNKYIVWGKNTEIYCTGDVEDINKDTGRNGIVKTTFDVLERKQVPIETSLLGNAICVNEYV